MSTPKLAEAPAVPAPERKPVLLPCPRCGEESASISIRLANLEDGEDTFECADCEETFSRSEVESILRRWGRLLQWLDTIPAFEDD